MQRVVRQKEPERQCQELRIDKSREMERPLKIPLFTVNLLFIAVPELALDKAV